MRAQVPAAVLASFLGACFLCGCRDVMPDGGQPIRSTSGPSLPIVDQFALALFVAERFCESGPPASGGYVSATQQMVGYRFDCVETGVSVGLGFWHPRMCRGLGSIRFCRRMDFSGSGPHFAKLPS